jgi:hypothetical protein
MDICLSNPVHESTIGSHSDTPQSRREAPTMLIAFINSKLITPEKSSKPGKQLKDNYFLD